MAFNSKRKYERDRRSQALGAERPGTGWNFSPQDAQGLQASILGEVVLPSADDYHTARQAFVVNFQCFPQIIIYCEVMTDVAACLAFARTHALSPVCRAGGHSTAGFSGNNDMIIDVSRIDQVVVDTENMRAYIGGGANFGKINAVLNSYKVHMPGGACDEVTIGGYLQCGGYGETSLMFGMNCDVLLEALVMLYDGSLVIANAKTNADLFWALRGGTGNNFGVLLQATYQLFDLYECWGFGLSWDVENIGSAMEALQRQYSGENTPENLGYQCTISFVEERPCLIFRGIVSGTQEDCQRLMQPLLGVEGARLDITPYQGSYSELDDSLNSNPSVPDVTIHTRTVANSRYIQQQLTATEWQEFGELILQSPNLTNFLGIEPYGGKINSVKKTDTAFIHRDVCFDIYIWVFWNDEEEEAASQVHLQQFMALMDKYSNGHSYQGYPNRDNADYRQLYWGESFNTLLAIKKKYDPIGLFTFEQAVSEIPDDAGDDIIRPKGDVTVDVSDDIVYASFN